jgi:hypothetical protein
MRREDIAELRQDIRSLRDRWDDVDRAALMVAVADVLESARNCIENLADELAEVEAHVKRLERDR